MDDTATTAPVGEIALHEFVHAIGVKGEAMLDGRLSVLLPAPGAIVRGDPELLTQALVSLLSAAAVQGEGAVELRVLREREAWRFEVLGECGGLAPDVDEADFDLHRAQSEQEDRAIALELLRGVAEVHGGSAGVEDRPGPGATFWLRLPKRL
jgi:signal transduction histidine kinase